MHARESLTLLLKLLSLREACCDEAIWCSETEIASSEASSQRH